MKTMLSNETRLCRSCNANLGHWVVPKRTEVRTPKTTLAVSRTRATTPVARVVYQSRCDEVTIMRETGPFHASK